MGQQVHKKSKLPSHSFYNIIIPLSMSKVRLFGQFSAAKEIQQSSVLCFDEIIGSLTGGPGQKGTRVVKRKVEWRPGCVENHFQLIISGF